MSTEMLSISAINYKRKGGNSTLSRYNRLKRKEEGQKHSFVNDLPFPESCPFGSNSVVNLWNEEHEYRKYITSIRGRDSKGKFLPLNY